MKKTIAMLAMFFTMLFAASSAHADNAGAWVKMDAKVPLVKIDQSNLNLRLSPELTFLNNPGRLAEVEARGGLHHACTNWFQLSLNGVSKSVDGAQDVRAEAQPEFTFALLPNLTLKDRNRVAYRALDSASSARWAYANEAKVVVQPDNSPVNLWAAYEGFVDIDNAEMNQHRVTAAVGHKTSDSTTLSVGYMFRTSKGAPDWVQDHFLYVLAEAF